MKNLLVVAVTVALLYLGYDALNPPPQPVVVAQAAPPAPPKVYFHSPLDAPAMSTSQHTGTGYFSTDANSRFTTGTYYDSGYSSGGSPVVYGAPGGRPSTPSTPSSPLGAAAARADAQRETSSRTSAYNASQTARARAFQGPIGTAR